MDEIATPAPPTGQRRRRVLLIGAAIGLIIGAALVLWHRDIDAPTAARIADKLQVQYTRGSGESPHRFGAREDARWADGWEFRWRYQPCPERASLRIWISRDGRRASYAEVPECNPGSGIGMAPLTV